MTKRDLLRLSNNSYGSCGQFTLARAIEKIRVDREHGGEFIEDFDFEPATALKFQMWAASSSVEGGMDESDLLLVHGITLADINAYYEKNPQNRPPHV